EIVEGAATAANFGIFNNQLTASWNETATTDAAFGLTFTATQDVILSEVLKLNSSRTAAEAYTTAGELQNVALNFNVAGFALYQNTPNPFNEVTVVRFDLPTAQTATLTITDAAGKVLKVINADYAAGRNEVELSAKSLAAGVLSYTLATEEFTATKKMVIFE
ncbi:MAG: T9SS type A sorting domain-containing protein, partial [Bacteroidota bacterium]